MRSLTAHAGATHSNTVSGISAGAVLTTHVNVVWTLHTNADSETTRAIAVRDHACQCGP